MKQPNKVAIIGMGAWGSAVAICLAKSGLDVWVVGRDAARTKAVQASRMNDAYLPGIVLPEGLTVTSNVEEAVCGALDVIVMIPSVAFTDSLTHIQPHLSKGTCVLWGTKGLAQDGQHRYLDEQARSVLGDQHPLIVLSGPSFATLLAQGLPTAVVLASEDKDALLACQSRLHGDVLRCYVNTDIKGVQLGGVMKNILAVAAGIGDGLNLGANARSALLTRGMQEVALVAKALGVSMEAVLGLSGMGDIILSSTSDLSRNRRLGLGIGQGKTVEAMTDELRTLEALNNIKIVKAWIDALGIEAAIIEAVYRVLIEGLPPRQAVASLMHRAPCQHLHEGLEL